MELIIVLGRVIFAAFTNVFQKQLTQHHHHPLVVVLASYLVLAVLSLAILFWLPVTDLSNTFWLNILLAALLDMAGTLFLVMSLSKTELSVFGPLNAYKVVISMLLAMLFLHEVPDLQGLIGITIIIIGSCFLLPPTQHRSQTRLFELIKDKGVQYRFLSILLFSIGTLPLKNAAVLASPLTTTVFWCLFGLPLAVLTYKLFTPRPITYSDIKSSDIRHTVFLGITIFMMQYTTLIVLSQTLIAYALALFQLSMVLQVFLGYHVFKEQDIKRRLIACLVMIIGSLLVLNT